MRRHFMEKNFDNSHWQSLDRRQATDRQRGDETILEVCPFCGKRYHCYVNKGKGVFVCHACGEKGQIARLGLGPLPPTFAPRDPLPENKYFKKCSFIYSYFDGKTVSDPLRFRIIKPGVREELLEDPAYGVERLKENECAYYYIKVVRRIKPETIEFFQIGLDLQGNLQFPFFNEHGLLVGYKYRAIPPRDKMMWRTKGADLCLFNIQNVLKEQKVYITEGEIDCLGLWQAGCFSVANPLGAMGWNDDWNKFLDKKEIVVVYDNDKAGQMGAEKLSKRLKGEVKVLSLQEVKNWQNLKEKK
jgi:hypothetical protein